MDTQNEMIEQVRCDLTRSLKNVETGRSGLTPQQVLRSSRAPRTETTANCASGLPMDARAWIKPPGPASAGPMINSAKPHQWR
jgi:hypothetical protein